MAFITKTVQKRPPRPYKPIDFRRMSKYCIVDGKGVRGDILGYVLVGCKYDLDCIYSSVSTLFKDKLIAAKEIQDALQAAITILEGILVSSIFVKVFAVLRKPLQTLLTALKAVDKLLDDALTPTDVCPDYIELIKVIKQYRGQSGNTSG